MEFKVGDRVKTENGNGTVIGIRGGKYLVKHDNWNDGHNGESLSDLPEKIRGTADQCWWFLPEDIKLSVKDQKIVITHDGHTTLARLYEGNKVIKSAESKCSPTDKFDFVKEGAPRAFNRLVGKEKAKEEKHKVL